MLIIFFSLDVLLPYGLAGGVPYLLLPLFFLWGPSKKSSLIIGLFSTLLMALGFFFHPPLEFGPAFANRLAVIFCFWIITGVLLTFLRVFSGEGNPGARKLDPSTLFSIFEHSPDPIIIKNLEGVILNWNKSAETFYGYSEDEMVGKEISIIVPPEVKDDIPLILRKIQRGESIKHYETVRKRKDGKKVHVSLSVTPLFKANGEIQGASVIGRDITFRKKSEERVKKERSITERKLKSQKERAHLANLAKSEILVNITHDLKTPLNGILGYTQILKRDVGLTAEQREFIEIIHRSSKHLFLMINDILDLAQIQAGKVELQPSKFCFKEFLMVLGEIIQEKARQKGVAFQFEVDDHLPWGVRGDEKRLRQVLLNLLGNGIRSTEKGKVTFKVNYQNGQGIFQIQDRSLEIAQDQLSEIPPLFLRTKILPLNLPKQDWAWPLVRRLSI